jgi:hypothetical protein
MIRSRFLFAAAASLCITTPTLAQDAASPKRVAVEDCVWLAVEQQLATGSVPSDIDAQLKIGRDAVELCDEKIVDWAKISPAVLELGEPLVDVADRMRMHFTARGALFVQGKAKPFYLEKSSSARTLSTPNVVPSPPEKNR